MFGLALPDKSIIALFGTLGAGKTTLAKGIAKGLEIEEGIVSPSFSLINEYHGRLKLYHIDLYRINSEEEFLELGTEEFLGKEGVSLIEWPEHAGPFLPTPRYDIYIRITEQSKREIRIEEKVFESSCN